MTANYPHTEPNDLYTRDFLIRVPNAFPHDSQPNKGVQHPFLLSFVASCLSMVAMVIYQLIKIRIFSWDLKMWILVLITGVVSFALAHIFETLFFGEK